MGYFEEFIGVNFWTALFVLLNTLTIYFVAKRFLFEPVMKIIQQRQQEIDGMYEDAEKSQAQAAELQTAYENKLSAAEDEAQRLVKESVLRGQNRQEEIIRQANAEADAIRKKAAADIAQEKKKAINDAKDEISVIALSIAGKVVGKQLQTGDQSALVDEFINELGEGL